MRLAIKKRTFFEIFLSLLLITSLIFNFIQKSSLTEKEAEITNQTYISQEYWDMSQSLQTKVVKQNESIIEMSEIIDIQIDIIRAQNKNIKSLLKELNAAPKL